MRTLAFGLAASAAGQVIHVPITKMEATREFERANSVDAVKPWLGGETPVRTGTHHEDRLLTAAS